MAELIAVLAAMTVFLLIRAVIAYQQPRPSPYSQVMAEAPKVKGMTQRQQRLLWGFGAALLALLFGRAVFGAWTVGALFSLVGVVAPGWVWHRRQERLRDRTIEQLEQVLVQVANAMAGGATPEMAWLDAAVEFPEPLGVTLRQIAQELQLGRPLSESLQAQSRHLGISELDLIARNTGILGHMGGNLSESYRRMAATIGQRRADRATLMSLTMDVRLNGHVVSALPFIIFAIWRVSAPEYVEPVLSSALGQIVLGFGAALVFLGWVWMSRMANVSRLE